MQTRERSYSVGSIALAVTLSLSECALAAGPRWQGPRLQGAFTLPTVCGSKDSLTKLATLRPTEEQLALEEADCQDVTPTTAFIIERVEGPFTLIELVDIGGAKRVSKGVWWAWTSQVDFYRWPESTK
jgi:hypothetical protein